MNSSEYKNSLSRREFLRIPRPKTNVILVLDNEKCTGCGLCTINCPSKALTLSQNGQTDAYQILFRQEICDACGVCEKSCPEHCLQMMDQAPEPREIRKDAKVIFDDKISKCMECGIPLYPQAMIKKLESKVFMVKKYAWPFHLCPSCRMKSQFKNGMLGNIRR
jgi:ferredoxin